MYLCQIYYLFDFHDHQLNHIFLNNNFHKEEPKVITPTLPKTKPITGTNTQKTDDPIQMIIDFYKKIDLQNIDDFNFSSIRDNKKITINITNL